MSSNPEFEGIQIESSLPKSWQEEQTFNDVLYEWMSTAPWLLISALAHLLAFFILNTIPWDDIFRQEQPIIQASIEVPQEEYEEPEEEPEEEIEEEPIEEPVLKDAEVSDHTETEDDVDYESTEGDFESDSPFDESAFNNVIGIGGGAGGKFSGRMGGKRNLTAVGGKGTEQAVKDGLEWLKNHQSPDGYWDCDDFMYNNVLGGTNVDGAGSPVHDVGVTGLALLAFLGDGHTTDQGQYKDVVSRGIGWLKEQQDSDTGQIGDRSSHEFLYNHAIATLAVCETYYFSKSPLMKGVCQKAVNFIARARNPYSAWRYEVPPNQENDTSITGWMVFALKSAQEAGLDVDPQAFDGALAFFNDATDTASGRVGYMEWGQPSSRITGVNDRFPIDKTETMTAVALLSRIFMGQDPADNPIMIKQADLMTQKEKLPHWDDDGLTNDYYYWYYGTYAMFQMSAHDNKYWKRWNDSMKEAVVDHQRTDNDYKGSWDPIGPWGHAGGRVYSTALGVLCLEVYFRYAKVLGAR